MSTLEFMGDVAGAGTALAGLLLVFMGNIAAALDSYANPPPAVVRNKFKVRVWIAAGGFTLALLAAFLALLAKWIHVECMGSAALVILFCSFAVTLFAAFRAALDVR